MTPYTKANQTVPEKVGADLARELRPVWLSYMHRKYGIVFFPPVVLWR